MVRTRVIETLEGIQDTPSVEAYDREMRKMWKRGWIETKEILKAEITQSRALEISPGPGYLGIDWLLKTEKTTLVALDISQEMLRLSRENAQREGVIDRATYVHGDACEMPFEEGEFHAVFANGGLHEWADPLAVFNEIARVLKPGGRYCITDLRRDAHILIRKMLPWAVREQAMRRGFASSFNAAYTLAEIREIVKASKLPVPVMSESFLGLAIVGNKPDVS